MEELIGSKITLRELTVKDCTQTYLDWLENKVVNQYLETRWSRQSLDSIKDFVYGMMQSPENYLMAIIENDTGKHIGNIKLGPINQIHAYADLSYFIGDTQAWGKGYATEAIELASNFGFKKLELNSIRAGAYRSNIGSIKALKKCGYEVVGVFPRELNCDGQWEDHVWLSRLSDCSL